MMETFKTHDAMGRERWEERPTPAEPERPGEYDPDLDAVVLLALDKPSSR